MKKNSTITKAPLPKKKAPVKVLAKPGQPPKRSQSQASRAIGYEEFKKIAAAAPFSQEEWAAILHLSERTLQRYAKSNSTFSAMHAERVLQVEKVLKAGKSTFGSPAQFYEWLKHNPLMADGRLAVSALYSYDGIEKIMTQLSRIQHGLFA